MEQVILDVSKAEVDRLGGLTEALIANSLDHPCLVKTHMHATVADQPQDSSLDGQRCTAWLVMEICNSGTLRVRTTDSLPCRCVRWKNSCFVFMMC